MILETERLVLREMKQTDFQDLAEILQNPKVMYAYEHDLDDIKDVQLYLKPEESAAYYVVNGEESGKVVL